MDPLLAPVLAMRDELEVLAAQRVEPVRHRGHTALKGLPPASRVPNLSGQNTRPPGRPPDRDPQLAGRAPGLAVTRFRPLPLVVDREVLRHLVTHGPEDGHERRLVADAVAGQHHGLLFYHYLALQPHGMQPRVPDVTALACRRSCVMVFRVSFMGFRLGSRYNARLRVCRHRMVDSVPAGQGQEALVGGTWKPRFISVP
jgi:hypothetical protein